MLPTVQPGAPTSWVTSNWPGVTWVDVSHGAGHVVGSWSSEKPVSISGTFEVKLKACDGLAGVTWTIVTEPRDSTAAADPGNTPGAISADTMKAEASARRTARAGSRNTRSTSRERHAVETASRREDPCPEHGSDSAWS